MENWLKVPNNPEWDALPLEALVGELHALAKLHMQVVAYLLEEVEYVVFPGEPLYTSVARCKITRDWAIHCKKEANMYSEIYRIVALAAENSYEEKLAELRQDSRRNFWRLALDKILATSAGKEEAALRALLFFAEVQRADDENLGDLDILKDMLKSSL